MLIPCLSAVLNLHFKILIKYCDTIQNNEVIVIRAHNTLVHLLNLFIERIHVVSV